MHRHLVLGGCIAFAVLTVATFLGVPSLRGRLLSLAGGGTIRTANGAMSLDLPMGWRQKQLTGASGQLQAANTFKDAYADVGVVAKADMAHPDLKPWADRCLKIADGRSKLHDRVSGDLSPVSIAGRTAYQCRVTGTLSSGTKVVYVKTYLETARHLCEVICWTTPSNEAIARPDFDAIAAHLADVPGR